jgi:hypothetical protein
MNKPIRGSCLCGGVRFEVDPPFLQANHCHCDRCRKHSGTAVCTQTRVRREQFHFLQGEELIKVYGKGEGAVKAFCIACASSLFGGDWPDGPQVSIRMGRSTMIQEFGRNFIHSSIAAPRGIRSPMIFRNILNGGSNR